MTAVQDWRANILRGSLNQRLATFDSYSNSPSERSSQLYERILYSPMDRKVWVKSAFDPEPKEMLMFGSNNYLGLCNDSRVRQAIHSAIDRFGSGVAGPALLNGSHQLHKELELALAELKQHEAVCLFPSGYQANLAIVQALVTHRDLVLFDEKSHASLIRGLRPLMAQRKITAPRKFRHNDLHDLRRRLEQASVTGDIYVACEGVYSMEGDVTDLQALHDLRQEFGFQLILDDAHGLGVMGRGKGCEHHFGVKADISMGTFSKTLGMTGGYVAGSHSLVKYLRYFGEAGVFSANLPIPTVAAVLEGVRIIQEEPERIDLLHQNARYLEAGLRAIGYSVIGSDSSILSVPIPAEIDIRQFNVQCHQRGLFINSIEPPAVPAHQQMLRLSVSAIHTQEDLDACVDCLAEVGKIFNIPPEVSCLVC